MRRRKFAARCSKRRLQTVLCSLVGVARPRTRCREEGICRVDAISELVGHGASAVIHSEGLCSGRPCNRESVFLQKRRRETVRVILACSRPEAHAPAGNFVVPNSFHHNRGAVFAVLVLILERRRTCAPLNLRAVDRPNASRNTTGGVAREDVEKLRLAGRSLVPRSVVGNKCANELAHDNIGVRLDQADALGRAVIRLAVYEQPEASHQLLQRVRLPPQGRNEFLSPKGKAAYLNVHL